MIEYFKKYRSTFFTFLILIFLFYGNALRNKYSLDDDYVTVTNLAEKGKPFAPNHQLVSKGIKGIPKIWKSRYAHDSEGAFDYRPFTTTTFAIEYSLFGQKPFISHLINILLYFTCVWLLFCCLLKLFEENNNSLSLAFLTSLFFLIHPIHTEVVNNLKCRDELLAFSFSLSALWFSLDLYKKTSLKTILLIVTCLALGLFSKKTTVLFIAIIPMCLVFFRKINLKKSSFILLSFIIVACIVPLVKGNVIDEKIIRHFYHFENSLYVDKVSLMHKIIIGIKTFGFYVKFLILPFPFRSYYGNNIFDLSSNLNGYFFLGVGFVLALSYLIYSSKNKILLFATLIFCISIAPFTNVGTPAPGVLAERFAYFSSMGFSLILAVIVINYLKQINYKSFNQFFSKPLVYLLPVILICMVYTWNRNSNWYNKLTLFEADIKYQENSAKANSLIANEYFEMLRSPNKKYPTKILIEKCIKHYTQAIKNDSTLYSAYNNVGVVYYTYLNDISSAKKFFLLATAHKDKYSQAYENLGNCYKLEKNFQKSFEAYKQAILFNQKQYTAYTALIDLFFSQKQYDKTLNIINFSEQQFPNNYELIVQKANCYLMKKDTLESIIYYEKAYKVNPNQNLARFIDQKHKETGNRSKAKPLDDK